MSARDLSGTLVNQGARGGDPWPVIVFPGAPVPVLIHQPLTPTYGAAIPNGVSTGTIVASTDIASIHIPAAFNKIGKLKRVRVSAAGGSGGRGRIRLRRFTERNIGIGGVVTAVNHDNRSPAPVAVLSSLPTIVYVAGDLQSHLYAPATNVSIVAEWTTSVLFEAQDWVILPGEGLAIQYTVDVALTTADNVLVAWEWTEE